MDTNILNCCFFLIFLYHLNNVSTQYGGAYVAEIIDDETNDLVWAVLSKWKGVYHFSGYYDSLEALEQGL